MKKSLAFMLIFGLLLCLLSACYTAPVASENQTVSEANVASPTSERIPVYDVPRENVPTGNMFSPASASSVDGFYVAAGKAIRVYDVETKTSYVPCYQTGCGHNDTACPANFGGTIVAFAEYNNKFYAIVECKTDSLYEFVCRDIQGSELKLLDRWQAREKQNGYYERLGASLVCLSHNAAYVAVTRWCYAPYDETGPSELYEIKSEYLKFDLDGDEKPTAFLKPDGLLCGVWEDRLVVRRSEGQTDALWEDTNDGGEAANCIMEEHNLTTGEIKAIAEKVTLTVDPNVCWGGICYLSAGEHSLCL